MQWPDMRLKTALILGDVLLLFCGFKLVISATVCSSFFRVTLDARFDRAECVQVYYNTSVMFLDDEVNIDRDVLDALEANAIDYVRTHGSYETDNSDTPQPYVSPYKEQTVQSLHRSILFRMAALGYDLNRIEDASPRPRANCEAA